MNYSVILGNLGNTRDRFLSSGYKDEMPAEEMFRQAVSIPGVSGIELVGRWDISASNAKAMGKLLKESGTKLVSIVPEHFSSKLWARGAFTSRDQKVRRAAVAHTKEMIDILVELGGELINLWPGQDGYDYILQGNFDEAYAWLVEGIREIADYRPEVKISLEFKPKEPRNFCYMARSADTLLTALETGRSNVGVTLDTGHALVGGENLGEAAFRLLKAGKLFHMHFNDNHQGWDDDMIVGSVHTLQYIELFFWLRKLGYTGWWSMDQYPYREDGREALAQSIAWIDALLAKLDAYGMDALEKVMRRGEATEITRELRRLLLG
jgi:sugar phosphate isomerase/epimerase